MFPSSFVSFVWFNRSRSRLLSGLAAFAVGGAMLPPVATADLVFNCAPDNDLYLAVAAAIPGSVKRFDTPGDAVTHAANGDSVLILAEGYPTTTTSVNAAFFTQAAGKSLRVYVEFPSMLPGLTVSAQHGEPYERAVVNSTFFGTDLQATRIVSINGMKYQPTNFTGAAHLVAARVAGFDTAVFGLPTTTYPLLFEQPNNVLVATTKLSGFVKGRYAPQEAWEKIWDAVLSRVAPDLSIPSLTWTPVVHATYGPGDPLPVGYQLQAITRGVRWYNKAKMIVHPTTFTNADRIPALPPETPAGDGTMGSMEAVLSIIAGDGTQTLSSVRRSDCMSETAMALAFGGSLLSDPSCTTVAHNILDYTYFTSEARKNERSDPNNGNYGLIAWGLNNNAWYRVNYGDDNARVILSTLAAAAVNNDATWDEATMMCLLGNLRTAGTLGFRGDHIDVDPLTANGWEYYFNQSPVSYAPHFESWLWACYLWAYGQTGDPLFLTKARTAIGMTMAQYTDGWRWTNGLAQEKARIVLPLAWLVRVDDTAEHRGWLMQAVNGLLALQDSSGAIEEELGIPGKGMFPPPGSNAAYGTTEASLIQHNGDKVSDLLYTTNFAMIALHEAAATATAANMPEAAAIRSGADKLAEFLCRIQITSATLPQVDGGWFRAFDYGRWEPWGSNSDAGWGAWAIESGWTQAWIISTLALRETHTSLWDLTKNSNIETHHAALRAQMIPPPADPDLVVAESVGLGLVSNDPAVTPVSFPVSNDPGATQTLTMTGVTLSGADASKFTRGTFPASLAPGASDNISFTFDSGGAAGIYTAVANIASNDSRSPATAVTMKIVVAAGAVISGVSYTYDNLGDLNEVKGKDAPGGAPQALTDGLGQAGVYTPPKYFWEPGEEGTVYLESNAHVGTQPQPRLTFDLGSSHDLSQMIVHYCVRTGSGVVSPASVDVSIDGKRIGNFAGFDNTVNSANFGDIRSLAIDLNGHTGKSIRLDVLGNVFAGASTSWLGLTEVVFLGKAAASPGEPVLKVPASIECGTIPAQPAAVPLSFSVSNDVAATGSLIISRVTFSGANGSNFALNALPGPLAPGISENVAFTFDSGGTAGTYIATVNLTSNDPANPTTAVPVTVTVEAPPPPAVGNAAAYRQAVLGDQPIFYWTFDEAAGYALDKMTEQAANALEPLGNATRIVSDIGLGNAAKLDGANGSYFFSNSLNAGQASYQHYAVELWVRLDDAVKNSYMLEGVGSEGNSPALIHGYHPNLEGYFSSGGRTGAVGPAILADNAWHHIVMEVDTQTNTHSLYINGTLDNTYPGSNAWMLAALTVGASQFGTEAIAGQIDELAFYGLSDSLTGQAIADHHRIFTTPADFRIQHIVRSGNDTVLTWTSVPGTTYGVETWNPASGQWESIKTDIPAHPTEPSTTDTVDTTSARVRMYRMSHL